MPTPTRIPTLTNTLTITGWRSLRTVSRLKGELAAMEEQLKQACDRETRTTQELQLEITTLTRTRDDALRKVMSLDASLGESQETVEATKVLERLWEAQLATVEEEMAGSCRLTNSKIVMVPSTTSCLGERGDRRAQGPGEIERITGRGGAASQKPTCQRCSGGGGIKQWLHEQKSANSKLASKLHQQNKQILLLNTEKQYVSQYE
ncbi:uncharacterized protein LOC121861917 [Homarus americanus]|uniref:uncharacterized protein LOC121861917 n=1 Tax=Homarus americanus TaxID=6706 RepID=UPI001C4727D2|nr:uncharacterized protein LOC121861917 [Homarus americanus]